MHSDPIPVEPLASTPPVHPAENTADTLSVLPPSLDDVRGDITLRRQRMRCGGQPKFTATPSRFLNLTNDFEFASWGSVFRISLTEDDIAHGNNTLLQFRNRQVLGQFEASALAANDILGGVFYALPSVFAASGVYSPLSLFIAALTLFLWRPVMEELGSALPISGAPYTYLLNVSSKSMALLAAALLLLDFTATAVVSAATASSYLAGEVMIPFPLYVGTILVLVFFTAVSLAGLRESARVASGILALHIFTMSALIIASAIAWSRMGITQLRDNWVAGQAEPSTPTVIIKQVFNGVCIGMLGLTGFECAPAYAAKMRPGCYPSVLRNLHMSALMLNTLMPLFVLALLPLTAQSQGNILSLLAQEVAGRWLRIWVAADAVIVLCAGVLTGILSACELLGQLTQDRVLPRIFLASLPVTASPYLAVLLFTSFSGVIYASTGADITVISKMFSVVWLAVMTLFPVSLILLRFSRSRLPRIPKCSLSGVTSAIAVATAVFAGNIAIDPTIAGWFILYFLALVLLFSMSSNKIFILRTVYWAYDQLPLLHRLRLTKTWGDTLIKLMRRLKRQELCLLVKTDEINYLFNLMLYVQQNEETSSLKIVHFCEGKEPSEMEANTKILDEVFPAITVDLMLVDSQFSPQAVAALAHRLQIPTSLMFMGCPGPDLGYSVAEYGTRIISL